MAHINMRQQSGFFELPGELRNSIYRLVPVNYHDDILLVEPKSISKYDSITQVCHQMREESLPIFCGENTFRAVTPLYEHDSLLRWLRAIGRERTSQIEHLTIAFVLSPTTQELQWKRYFLLRRFILENDEANPNDVNLYQNLDHKVIRDPARALATVVLFNGVKAKAVFPEVDQGLRYFHEMVLFVKALVEKYDEDAFSLQAARAFRQRIVEDIDRLEIEGHGYAPAL